MTNIGKGINAITQKKKKFDCIYLDLDGPILDGKLKHYKCYKDIIDKYGGYALDIEEYWEMKRNKINRKILLEKSNFNASYEVFFNEWLKNIELEKYLIYDILKPKVKETLGLWKNFTENLILVTMRQNRSNLLKQLENLQIIYYFDEVIDCNPFIENSKYQALKNKIFKDAIFVGDTEEDIKTANMLNIKCVAITNGIRDKRFLIADYYAEEIKDIRLEEIG